MRFSIGYNFDIKLLELLENYKNNLEALYFPVPQQYLGSGRAILQPKHYLYQIPEIIKKCNSLNITPQLLLNATCEGRNGLSKNFFKQLLNYIKKLKDLGLGSVVITNPIYINRIKKEISDLIVESSVNCYVRTVEHALFLKDLGVDVLTIDRDINRNIPLIKNIKNRTGLKIRIMLNEGCLRNCPFRVMHYNYLSHSFHRDVVKKLIDNIFFDRFCIQIYLKHPEKVFSIPFIPPDALRYYMSFVDYYKLSTRTFDTNRIELCLKAYISQEFSGNLVKILDCPGLDYFEYIDYNILKKNNFFKKMINCSQECNICNYCNYLLKKAVVFKRDFLKNKTVQEEKRAIKIYRNALKNSLDKVSIYTELSKAYFNLRKYKNAIRLAHKIIKLAPREITGYTLLGYYYENIKKIDKAKKVYKKALKIFPFNGSIYLSLSRVYFLLKKFREAINTINKIIVLNYRESNMYLLLGLCYEKLGQYRKAIKAFEKEEEINPNDAQVNFSLTRCYRRLGQIKRATKELDKGIYKIKRQDLDRWFS